MDQTKDKKGLAFVVGFMVGYVTGSSVGSMTLFKAGLIATLTFLAGFYLGQ